jgi:uncharacterized protein YndB with AHSA1/START domain
MTMSELTSESTVYVIYIAATPAKVWAALTSSEFTTQYFFGRSVESDWKPGSPWILRKPDGGVDVRGVVRESDPPRRLVVSWNIDAAPALPECLVSYEIEPVGDSVVRLTMTEAHPTPIAAVLLEGGRKGWPMILSGLKSLLETGRALAIPGPAPPKQTGG